LPNRNLVFAALIVVQVLFGMNYVISKVVVEAFPPILWASIRIIIASIVMFSAALVFRKGKFKPKKGFFKKLIIFALLGVIINQTCFLVGLKYTTSPNSAILNTLIPIFTLLIVTITGKEPLTRWRALGFLSAFAGVLAILKVEEATFSSETLYGDFLTIINAFSFSCFLAYSKDFIEKYDRTWVTAWLFFYGSIGITTLAIPYWQSVQWPEMTSSLWACSFYAVFGGTILTYFLNNWSLAYTQASHVALFIYIQPVIASLLVWIWRGEAPTNRTIISSLLIFMGLIFSVVINERASQKRMLRTSH